MEEAIIRLREAENIFETLNAKGENERIEKMKDKIKCLLPNVETLIVSNEDKRLKTLYRMGQIVNSITYIDKLLEKILDLTISVTGAERGFILMGEEEEMPTLKTARNMDGQSLKDMQDFSNTIIKDATFNGELILTTDAKNDPRFKNRMSIANFNLLSIICVPLRVKDNVIGAIYIDNRKRENVFTQEDLEFIKAFADQCGIAIENARLVAELKAANERLVKENVYLKNVVADRYGFDKIIGKSEPMQKIYHILEKVADSDASVLIEGETGTGKELVANAIHYNSQRKDRRFIIINCGALPEHLLESELFGHIKGAFTGAIKDKEGLFEVADNGTVFLDEVSELSPILQSKLLRVLQDGEIRKVGGTTYKKVNVRIIAATNKKLDEEVEIGTFRKDLYYRLNVIPIKLPTLQERKKDIPLLAKHFLAKFRAISNKNIKGFANEVMQYFVNYNWKGNIRELENIIEAAVVMTENPIITLKDMPDKIIKQKKLPKEGKEILLSYVERGHIIKVLEFAKQKKSKTAKLLGISRPTLYKKIKEYEIE
ncbi:MAG: sigma 54-interacting transcriptional regulator [Candidatus Stahlbacteria bacterium]|nr:sigma 54-interacting transcriptional regulator [Candidatus Stahlbacteria bacterium]